MECNDKDIEEEVKYMDKEGILTGLDENDNIEVLKQLSHLVEMETRKKILANHPYAIWYQESTGRWITSLPDGKGGKIRKKNKDKRALEDQIVAYWRSQDVSPTIEEIFNSWNDERLEKGDIKPATHYRTKQTFERHFGKIKDDHIKSYNRLKWEIFLQDELSGHKLYAKAWGNLRALFRGMITYARRHGWVKYYPDEIISDVEVTKRTFKEHTMTEEDDCFSLEERQKIMEFIMKEDESKRLVHHLGIMLLFLCGLRVGELAALKPSDIENGDMIHVQRTETRYKDENGKIVLKVDDHPKTVAGDRRVPIPEDYLWVLDEIRQKCPEGEWLLTYRGKRITACGYRKQLYNLCDATGIKHKSPHKARKTYVSILMENGTPDYLVERLAGHTDIRTSKQSYLRDVGFCLEADAVNRINEFKDLETVS